MNKKADYLGLLFSEKKDECIKNKAFKRGYYE